VFGLEQHVGPLRQNLQHVVFGVLARQAYEHAAQLRFDGESLNREPGASVMPSTPSSPTTPPQRVLSQSSTSTLRAGTVSRCVRRASAMASVAMYSSVNGMWASRSASASNRSPAQSASTACGAMTSTPEMLASATSTSACASSYCFKTTGSRPGDEGSIATTSGVAERCMKCRTASTSSTRTRSTRSASAAAVVPSAVPYSPMKSCTRASTTFTPPVFAPSMLPGASNSWKTWL